MYAGPGSEYLILGVLLAVSFLLGIKIRRDKGFFVYLVMLGVVFFAAMGTASLLAENAWPGSLFRRFGRDASGLGVLLWAPYLLAGFLAWLFKPGKGSAAPHAANVRTFAATQAAAEPSLARQTFRRVVVTVAAAVISYAILSFMGLASTPSIVSAIGLALLAIVFG